MRWARPSTIAGASSRNEHLYNGKELAEELGLNWYHYGARYYDVALARWAEMDPADQFHSPYSYVGGDPVNLVDPDGRQATSTGVKQNVRKEERSGVEAGRMVRGGQQFFAGLTGILAGGLAFIWSLVGLHQVAV